MAAVSPVARANRVSPLAAPPDVALTDLYEQHANRVFGFCLKWLRSREEAEDAVQTTFLYAMRGLRRGVVPDVEAAWLLTIARNVCLSRTAAARRRRVEVVRDPQVLAESVPAPPRSDELEGLSEALTGLTEQQRRAILMREWQGLSYREIAQELELSQAAVETLLFRARRALASRLRSAGSFLPWLKSLTGPSGAGKLAMGATIVAVTAAAGTVAGGGHERQPAPAKKAAAPALREARSGVAAAAARLFRLNGPAARIGKPTSGRSSGAASVSHLGRQPTEPQTAAMQRSSDVANVPTAAETRRGTTSTLTQPVSDTTVSDTAQPVADAATGAVGALIGTVSATTTAVSGAVVDPVAATVDTAASTATNAAATVSTAVPAIPAVPALLTP